MKTNLKFLVFVVVALAALFSNSSITAAPLPNSLPTNAGDARIYAMTHTVRLDRSAWSYPAGEVKLFSQSGAPIDSYRQIKLQQPSSSENLIKATDADKFKFALPTSKQGFAVYYHGVDAAGFETVRGSNSFMVKATGKSDAPWSIPSGGQSILYRLGQTFTFELDANMVSIMMIDPNTNEVTQETLEPVAKIGERRFFQMPSWWFDRPEYLNGLTYAYGDDQFGQYVNATGNVAGITPINFAPVSGVHNHFRLTDGVNPINSVFVTVQSWNNEFEDPTYEYKPLGQEGTQKVLQLNAQTTDGAKPVAVKITEQDSLGNLSSQESTMDDGADYSKIKLLVSVGKVYYIKFLWPDFVRLGRFPG